MCCRRTNSRARAAAGSPAGATILVRLHIRVAELPTACHLEHSYGISGEKDCRKRGPLEKKVGDVDPRRVGVGGAAVMAALVPPSQKQRSSSGTGYTRTPCSRTCLDVRPDELVEGGRAHPAVPRSLGARQCALRLDRAGCSLGCACPQRGSASSVDLAAHPRHGSGQRREQRIGYTITTLAAHHHALVALRSAARAAAELHRCASRRPRHRPHLPPAVRFSPGRSHLHTAGCGPAHGCAGWPLPCAEAPCATGDRDRLALTPASPQPAFPLASQPAVE